MQIRQVKAATVSYRDKLSHSMCGILNLHIQLWNIFADKVEWQNLQSIQAWYVGMCTLTNVFTVQQILYLKKLFAFIFIRTYKYLAIKMCIMHFLKLGTKSLKLDKMSGQNILVISCPPKKAEFFHVFPRLLMVELLQLKPLLSSQMRDRTSCCSSSFCTLADIG